MNKKFMPNYSNDSCSSASTISTDKESNIQEQDISSLLTKEMAMKKYKRYIHDRIFKMPIHPSLAETQIAINISEEAFEHMKEDPAYETQVMELLEHDLGSSYPLEWAPRYSVFKIGKTIEDYHVSDRSSILNNKQATFTL